MLWLFIVGVAFDLSGAAVIAWPTVHAHRTELREEGTTRLGRNAWVIVARTREQRFGRFGVGLLGLGFLLQLLAYLAKLGGTGRIGLALFLVATLVAFSLIVRSLVANRGLPRYASPSEAGTRLDDIRDMFQLRDLRDVERYWRILAGPELKRVEDAIRSYVSQGRWVADCACGGGIATSPALDVAACVDCARLYNIVFPVEREQIESVLLARPDKRNRNWRPGETLESLQAENAQHGFPPLFVGGDVFSPPPQA